MPESRPGPREQRDGRLARARGMLSFRNISALYIFALLFILYSLWVPDTFLTANVWRALLDSGALTGLVAVALILPLAAGAFDLAIGAEVGLGAILVAWLLQSRGIPVVPSILLTMAGGALIGIISGLLITRAGIDSFVATLGMSSVLLALIAWLSGGQQILSLPDSFQSVATTHFIGITTSVWIMLGAAILVWYVLERTAIGRRVYATGGNQPAARLAGVSTGRVVVCTLAACGAIAGLAGLLASARLATGDPTVGPGYLLPAYAAAFLGSTQFRGGRYNVWGTIVAVYVLAVGVKGLQLGGAPVWIPDLFNGVALILAVGMSRLQRTSRRGSAIWRTMRSRGAAASSDLHTSDPLTPEKVA